MDCFSVIGQTHLMSPFALRAKAGNSSISGGIDRDQLFFRQALRKFRRLRIEQAS